MAQRVPPGTEQDALCATATAAFARVDGWGLVRDSRVDYALGMLASRTGDWAQTEARLAGFLADPTAPRDWRKAADLTYGNALYQQGRFADAERVFAALLAREPEFAPARVRLDEVRQRLKR